jgi:hypothetical protein
VTIELLQAAIGEITQHRRAWPADQAADGPDPVVFDQETLGDLLDFLRDARRGLLAPDDVVHEARIWQKLVDVGWTVSSGDSPVERAVDMLAGPPPGPQPQSQQPGPAERPARAEVEPANDLEHALAAVVEDEAARPALWHALHRGELVLPVVATEEATLQFLCAPASEQPLVFGFATEERFDSLLPNGSEISRVLAPGSDIPKIWPAGHWLMVNPGYANSVVLSPSEVTGLPHGPLSELPHPRTVELATPGDDDEERAVLLAAAVVAVAGCAHVTWALARARTAPERSPWRDVLVVHAASGYDQAAVVQSLIAALPPSVFPSPTVLGGDADLVHPLVAAVLEAGRSITPP